MTKIFNFLNKEESKRSNKISTSEDIEKVWKESVLKLMIYQQYNNLT